MYVALFAKAQTFYCASNPANTKTYAISTNVCTQTQAICFIKQACQCNVTNTVTLNANDLAHAGLNKEIVYLNPLANSPCFNGPNQNSGNSIKIYQHINYEGGMMEMKPGDRIPCLDQTERNTSFWGYFVDWGDPVRNDEVSSIQVGKGLCVKVFEHRDYTGRSATFCGNVSDLRTIEWNDIITSLYVIKN